MMPLLQGGASPSPAAAKNGGTSGRSAERSTSSLFFSQSKALLKKRLLTFRRDKKMWAFVIFMPIVFIGGGVALVLDFKVNDQPALALSPQVRAVVLLCHFCRGGHAPLPPLHGDFLCNQT